MSDVGMNLYNELHGLTVPGLLRRRACGSPTALALSAPGHRGGRDRLSYAQLVSRMESVARGLVARGAAAGDRIALFLSNAAMREGVLTALGCYRLGAIVAPLNVRGSDDELRHALTLIEPAFIVTTAEMAERMRALYAPARHLIVGGTPCAQDSWPDPESEFHRGELPDPVSAESPTVLLFTSGTTAKAKAVMHCHRSQLYCGYAIGGAIGLRSDDVYQGAWPIFTSSVLNLACMSAWVHGACVTLEETTLDNRGRLLLIESEGATVYHGVTSPLHFMIDEYASGGYDLSRVRRIAYGGATMPVEVIEKFRERLPWADQVHVWGMTETGPAGTYLPPWFLPRKAGCIGIPQPGCAIRAVDDDGAIVPVGASGELMVSGPAMALGYFRNPDASAETFVDGWVRTGDIGRVDDEGHFHFVDRKKDIINRGGLKISSAAVEDAIYAFPGVVEAAVIAVPHAGLGEEVAACVVAAADTGIDTTALQEHCARRLADYEVPRRWFFLSCLPKNPMGKILKRELRAAVLAQVRQQESA